MTSPARKCDWASLSFASGPYKSGPWGCSTRSKDKNTVYLHVLGAWDGILSLPDIPARVKSSRVLTGGFAHITQKDGQLTVKLDNFDKDKEVVEGLKERYRKGGISDVEVKERLTYALNLFLKPIRERRAEIEKEKGLIEEVLYDGNLKMNDITNDVLKEVMSLMGLSGTWNKISRIARERKNG